MGFTPEAMGKLSAYSWPGNIRDLRNAIEYAFVLCPSGAIGTHHLPPKIGQSKTELKQPDTLVESSKNTDRDKLIEVLKQAGGKQSEAARILGVS